MNKPPEVPPEMYELCPKCIEAGETICWLYVIASQIAASPNLTPEMKAAIIAENRPVARKRTCRHVNSVDPDYTGKSGL